MQYKTVVELYQKLHLKIYSSQFMTSQIIPLPFVLLYLESKERKGKKFEYAENKKSFFDEIEKKIIVFEGLSFGGKTKI